jgi:hypothetical protein
VPEQSVVPLGHWHEPELHCMPPVQATQLVQPQLAVVPAQYALAVHDPAEHESAVQELPSSQAAQPLRFVRVLVTEDEQLVPLHECMRYS